MESAMRFGFGLPQIGPAAGPDSLVAVAKRAEELGINSLWVSERILYPLEPKTPYPGSPEGKLPYQYKSVLDPLDTLTFVAAHTSRVGLGTSTINLPYYNPVMLARRLDDDRCALTRPPARRLWRRLVGGRMRRRGGRRSMSAGVAPMNSSGR